MSECILIVDDEPSLLVSLSYMLRRNGYDVLTASDGAIGLSLAELRKPDLIVLDVMLPGLDGFEVCRQLRKQCQVPILMLSARDDAVDRVVGLEVGADDYVTKPFSVREVVARIKAHLRRSAINRVAVAQAPATSLSSIESEVIQTSDITLDVSKRIAVVRGEPVVLKRREFDLLVYLVRNAGIVVSRNRLLTTVWSDELEGGTRTVDVHIRRLRCHIESDPANPEYIVTVRGTGYAFRHRVVEDARVKPIVKTIRSNETIPVGGGF